MSRRTRHATYASGDTSYPSLANHGYVSDYFLTYRLEAGLKDLYDRWETQEHEGHATPRSRLRNLSATIAAHRAEAAATAPDTTEGADEPIDPTALPRDAINAQRALCADVTAALGWHSTREMLELTSGATALQVPVLHARRTPSGLLLVVLESVFGSDPSAVVASKAAAAGTLLEPVTAGDKVVALTALEAAQALFTAEGAPDYVLVCSGAALVLLDRERWGEGMFLGVDLDAAAARSDTRAKGELAAIAALFSADAIDPGADAQSHLAALIDKAANESAGVSKELRHGMRRSVELLAKAAVADIRTRQKQRWQDIDAEALTRECLRYLYRIIVLLYAEARPELGIVPANDPDYQAGYSVARLRDLALVDLHGAAARDGNHIQQSLAQLFALVNDGYAPAATLDDVRTFEITSLRSALFGPDACTMLDKARLPDSVLQQVLANLCFTQEHRGRRREVVSYATLGINQLGAVYEGLMAYRGFLATEELYEIAKNGDPDDGTWVIAIDKADEYPDEVFVKEPGPAGEPRRVRYDTGDFVYRLSGRDRQRSASYYTPEVLTEFTVRHALDVYEEEHPDMKAADWLDLTVCEPALGSGAFANEAITQLATRYLKAAQRERGERIDPDQYQLELQKAKAHFAINRTYGVDLNGTAVELAEVSLWLNVMHPGLSAPRFGARLKRGNSLIGARRATYTKEQVATAPWKGTTSKPVVPPTDRRLSDVPLGEADGIHHFLLPGEGWGAVADATELRGTRSAPGLATEWAAAVKAWRTSIQKPPKKTQIDRLAALAKRVELAWAEAAKLVDAHVRAHERRIDVWGADHSHLPPAAPRRAPSGVGDADGPVARLKLLMDAWCALWMWAPEHGTELPTLTKWLDAIELLFGQRADETGTLFSLQDTVGSTMGSVDYFGRARVSEVLERHPWLAACQRIDEAQAFFHWELTFGPVFNAGGFDLQVGNPPWVRLDWEAATSLAEKDPWWGVADLVRASDAQSRERRTKLLVHGEVVAAMARDIAEISGTSAFFSAGTREPHLVGLRTNLYMVFMTNTWRRASVDGVVGLVHPEAHFTDPRAGLLRSATYQRLRRHWHFVNEAKWFPDIGNRVEFGVCVYGGISEVHFVQAVNTIHPTTVDRSIGHDGTGELPGLQYPDGGWDLRPHLHRLVVIDESVLSAWVGLFDSKGTPPAESRLMRPLTREELGALQILAAIPEKVRDLDRYWTTGFNEKLQKDDGTIEWQNGFPENLADCVLQGPHIANANPFAQQPREGCRNHRDWEQVDLETLPIIHVPRTNYRRVPDAATFASRHTSWAGKPYTHFFREVHRTFVDRGDVRTLRACIMPPGPAHTGLASIWLGTPLATARLAGLLTSLPYDYLVKTTGTTGITKYISDGLPVSSRHDSIDRWILLRTLRLNCVIAAHAPLWNELFNTEWRSDQFVSGIGTESLGDVSSEWLSETPLRRDLDRWLAECEIDALAALSLNLPEHQLLQMYRSQFSVLRKYEYVTVFDANGRQISGIHHNYGYRQREWEDALKIAPTRRGERKVGMWDRVQAYMKGDTSVDLGTFVPPFVPADREKAMSTAYRAFQKRLEAS